MYCWTFRFCFNSSILEKDKLELLDNWKDVGKNTTSKLIMSLEKIIHF